MPSLTPPLVRSSKLAYYDLGPQCGGTVRSYPPFKHLPPFPIFSCLLPPDDAMGGTQISSYNSIIITVGRKRKLRTRFIIGNYIARSKMPFYEFLGNYGAHQLVLKVASI